MSKIAFAFLPVVMGFALALNATAEDNNEASLADFKMGTHVSGPQLSMDDLKGKAVVLDYWGVNCGPCIALMPELTKIDKRYRKDGLVIIGAESQQGTPEQIEKLTKKARTEYTVVSGMMGPDGAAGLPYAMVFDATGKRIWKGRPGGKDFTSAIRQAVHTVSGEVTPITSMAAAARKAEEEAKGGAESKAREGNLLEAQTWKNSDGKEIVAAVESATEDEVIFLMRGKKVYYPLRKLSEDSQRRIRSAYLNEE